MKGTMLARVRAYLEQRRALGYKLHIEGQMLLSFARYADRSGHRGPLTRQLALRWAALPKSASRLADSDEIGQVFRFVSDTGYD